MGKIITQLDLYRNTGTPLQGCSYPTWGYAGSCLTAQTAVFRKELLDDFKILSAYWRICWLPNIPSTEQTAVRLLAANSGPSNVTQIAASYSGTKANHPLNEAFDILADLQAWIGRGEMFQLTQQSCGNGTFGCLIYSSSIELILGT